MAKKQQSQAEEAELKEEAVLDPVDDVEQAPKAAKGMVKVNCQYPIQINGKVYSGIVDVSNEVAECLVEMLSKKKRADLEVHMNRNFQIERVLGNELIVSEVNGETKRRV